MSPSTLLPFQRSIEDQGGNSRRGPEFERVSHVLSVPFRGESEDLVAYLPHCLGRVNKPFFISDNPAFLPHDLSEFSLKVGDDKFGAPPLWSDVT